MCQSEVIREISMSKVAEESFFALVMSRPVVTNAIKVALVVGTILAFINYGGKILTISLWE